MSKPQPINYRLHSWELRFVSRKGTLRDRCYEVKILWEAIVPRDGGSSREALTSREDKLFSTCDEAMEWINGQVTTEGGEDE